MRVSGCKALGRDDTSPLSLRGAKRRGNPYSLQYHKTKRNTLGKYEKHNEFALSTTDLPGFSAGMRIATPVCALARNDMQKEGRVRGCKALARNDMLKEGRVRGCKAVWRVGCAEICNVSAEARDGARGHAETCNVSTGQKSEEKSSPRGACAGGKIGIGWQRYTDGPLGLPKPKGEYR